MGPKQLLAAQRAANAARQRKKRANRPPGNCVTCIKRAAVPGKAKCEACAQANVPHVQAYKERAIDSGKCGDCRKRKARKGHVTCGICSRAAVDRRKLANLADKLDAEAEAILARGAVPPLSREIKVAPEPKPRRAAAGKT